MTSTAVRFAEHDLTIPSAKLGELRDSNHLLDDPARLGAKLAEDGCLLIRGLHERDHVLEARQQILTKVAEQGKLDPTAPLMEARIGRDPGGAFFGGLSGDPVKMVPAYQSLIRAPRLMRFFDRLLGSPSATYDFQWLRLVSQGEFTGAHYDIVYMGRGTANVYTVWTPLGDIGYEQGPLAVAVGSHTAPELEKVRQTYGRMDVDRDHVSGWLSNDPIEIADRFKGRWQTTEFKAGDAIIFGMFTLHASLTNTSDRYRLSSDTRYQRADEPMDERWVGQQPKGHYSWHSAPQVPMEQKRKEWGI